MRLPLKAKLTLWYIVLFTLIVGLWAGFVVVIARANLQAGTDRALASRATQIVAGFTNSKDSEFPGVSDSTVKGAPRTESISQLLSGTGAVIEHSGDPVGKSPMVGPLTVAKALRTGSAQLMTVVSAGERFRVLLVKLPKSDRLILVGSATETTDAAVERLVLVMLLTGPLVLLAAAVGGWFFADRALRPVSRMTRTAATIGIDDLDARVAVPPGSDELSDLAETLNSMLDRLQKGVREKRRFVADASHELQTPLAVMRAELDVSLGARNLTPESVEVLESAREETDRMTRIVRNLLTLARFDDGKLRMVRVPVDLHLLCDEAVESLGGFAKAQNVAIACSGESATVIGDADYLRMVVVNLLENGIKYSGDRASVEVTTGTKGDRAWLRVKDNGPGIEPAVAERVFDRFYRADRSRVEDSGGSGLGLAISREIVQAHHGEISLESEVGVGSTFAITLPAVSAGPAA